MTEILNSVYIGLYMKMKKGRREEGTGEEEE